MNPADALDIAQSAIWTVIVASSPAVIAAMVVGILIALLQALDAGAGGDARPSCRRSWPSLSSCRFAAPFVGAVIFTFAEQTYARIPNGF